MCTPRRLRTDCSTVCVGCARVSERAQHFGGLAIAAHGMATIQVTAAWIVGAPLAGLGSPEDGSLFFEVPWSRSYVTVRGSHDEPVLSLWENVVALPGSIPHGWCV
jgi:hypothetical protein